MNSEAAPGEGVAAFFDLDGTMIPPPSLEKRFFRSLRQDSAIPLRNYLRWSMEALRLLPKGIAALQHANKRHLTGLRSGAALQYLESVTFFEEAIGRVVWHARYGHEIVLVSGTLEPLAQMAATALECELEAQGVEIRPWICATRLEEERGRWTGRLKGEATYGAGKARAIAKFAREHKLDLRQCHAYGNSLLDRQLLRAVGHAHTVNPGKELAALANQGNWTIWNWHQEKKMRAAVNSYAETRIQQTEDHV